MMLSAFLFFSVLRPYSAQSLHPVLLTHGYYATRLLYTTTGSGTLCPPKTINSTLWLNLLNFIDPVSNACWLESATLHYDNKTRKSYSASGVKVTTFPFGDLDAVEWLAPTPQRIYDTSYYYNLVEALVAHGYERNKNIKAAPYDWRRAPNENTEWFANLKKLIEEMYEANNRKSVIIVIHSMTSQFVYVFLNQMTSSWKDRYVRSWILLASCLGGTFKYQYAYFGQDDYPANLFPVSRLAVRTYSTTAFLLPRVAAFGNEVLIKSENAEYRAEEYDRFFTDLGYPDALEQWKDVRSLYDPNNIRSPGNFSIYCVAGFGLQTLVRTIFNGPLSRATSFQPVYGDGDTFVNANSLRLCYRLGEGKQNFGVKEFPNTDHLQTVRDPGPISYVIGVIEAINHNRETFTREYV